MHPSLEATITNGIGFVGTLIAFCCELRCLLKHSMAPDKATANNRAEVSGSSDSVISIKNMNCGDIRSITSISTLITILLYMAMSVNAIMNRSAEYNDSKLWKPMPCDIFAKSGFFLYQLSKASIYNVLILRLEMAYRRTPFRYSNRVLYTMRIILAIHTVGCIFVAFGLAKGDKIDGSCEIDCAFWGVAYTLIMDLFFIIANVFLFNRPLRLLINRSSKFQFAHTNGKNTDIDSINNAKSHCEITSLKAINGTAKDCQSKVDLKCNNSCAIDSDIKNESQSKLILNKSDISNESNFDTTVTIIGSPISVQPSSVPSVPPSVPPLRTDDKLQNLAIKYTVLSTMAVLSTLLYLLFAAAFQTYYLFCLDLIINLLCLLLMRSEYQQVYVRLCYLPHGCWKCCCRLYSSKKPAT